MKGKFYFKGKVFENEHDFWEYVNIWGTLECSEEEFNREWATVGKNIFFNLMIDGKTHTNDEVNILFQKIFEYGLIGMRKIPIEKGLPDLKYKE